MSQLKEKIEKIYPAATFEDGECLQVNVAEPDWHDFAKKLNEDGSRNIANLANQIHAKILLQVTINIENNYIKV